MKLYKDSIVYLLCPAYAASGGPEAIHALSQELNRIGINSIICYIGYNGVGDPVHPLMKCYDIRYTQPKIINSERNIIIIPEVWPQYLNSVGDRIQKCFWWLSVDNSPVYKQNTLNCLPADIHHFCQSQYAIDYLHTNGIVENVSYVSDYINSKYIDAMCDSYDKEDILIYNPAKGIEYTKLIINKLSDIQCIPLCKLNHTQLIELYKRSKVYIDFGNHPGMDRIPREAALFDNIVITNTTGSAYNDIDVNIPKHYKFNTADTTPEIIATYIQQCVKNYNNCIREFDSYRQKITNQYTRFVEDIKNVFLINE